MRVAFIGASALTIMTAHILLERGHEVIIVEKDMDLITELSEQLDCGFLHGNGSKPAILRELHPERIDLLYCLTNSDETNIIASLVARSLGFPKVVPRIEDPEFEHICFELGLEHTIVPTRTSARYLAAMLSGQDILELSAMVRDDVRFFAFIARDLEAGSLIKELKLPPRSRIIYLYRDSEFLIAEDETKLKKGDEVVIVTHRDHLDDLIQRWSKKAIT